MQIYSKNYNIGPGVGIDISIFFAVSTITTAKFFFVSRNECGKIPAGSDLNSTTKTTRHTLKKVPASVPPISMSFCLKVRAHVCVHVCAREREREIMEMKQKEYR